MGLHFTHHPTSSPFLTAVAANRFGEIYELDGYAAVGMTAGSLIPLSFTAAIPMPPGSELMRRLPQRGPVRMSFPSGERRYQAEPEPD